jgi:hypothetical protein
MNKRQTEYALSLCRRFGATWIDHVLSVLSKNPEDDWPEIMHLLKTKHQPGWFR